jgi:3-oxoacyl-[acyl-carrier protein] reductase
MSTADFQLDGQWALVTGSTHGIGRAVALELAAAGANVIIHGRDEDAANEVRSRLSELGRESHVLIADLADADAQQSLVEQAWSHHPLDACIHVAGADVLTGAAADWSFEQKLEQLWKVDVSGTINVARAVGGRMVQRGRGAIVTIGWDQAELGMAGDSGELFSAVKGAIIDFTRSLAKSLAPAVRVNCIAPGWIRTAWGEQASEYWQERVVNESLLRRWGEVEDVARAARFLVSPAASFITGQTLAVNGGRP